MMGTTLSTVRQPRVVITGMSINTAIGDTLDGFLSALLTGTSALGHWKQPEFADISSKVGADISDYDFRAKARSLAELIPAQTYEKLNRFVRRSPWSTKLSALLAVDAFLDANLFNEPVASDRIATLVAGHNINMNYKHANRIQFADEPDYIDSLYALHCLDTDHAGTVSELLNCHGPAFTLGSACASGNTALRQAVDEIRYHEQDVALVVGPVFDFSPVEVHGMTMLGAISADTFAGARHTASRPFDVRRDGFIPAHAGAVLVVESLESALRRGSRIYAEIVGVEASADGNHLPQPSEERQAQLIANLLRKTGVAPEQIDYVNAHATSTPIGDVAEIGAIKTAFGSHAAQLKINAPKSLLGHACWSAATVEMVAAVLQMRAGELHGSANIDELEPEIDLEVCAKGPIRHEVNYLLKNSFGVGGPNCVAIVKRFEERG